MESFCGKWLIKTSEKFVYRESYSLSPLRYIVSMLNALCLPLLNFFIHQIERCLCLEASLISPVLVAPTSLISMGSVYFSFYTYHNTVMLCPMFVGDYRPTLVWSICFLTPGLAMALNLANVSITDAM